MSSYDIYLESMKELLQEDFVSYCEAMKQPAVKGIRINPLKMENTPIHGLCTRPSSYAENGWIAETESVGGLWQYLTGCIYSQEPSASYAVTAMGIQEGMKVLDLCAAPGSKSTQIAELLHHTGLLVANEINPKRAAILKENIERHGAANVIVTNAAPEQIALQFPAYFDAVLCDAPCSGEGMFRKDPGAIKEWNQDAVEACAKRQRLILSEALTCLKPGGILLYSTCTFSKEENEENVQWLLEEFPFMELIEPAVVKGREGLALFSNSQYCRRIYPMDEGEGHFVARFRKQQEQYEEKPLRTLISDPIPNEATAFLKEHLDKPFPYLFSRNNVIYGGTFPFIDVRKAKLIRHQTKLGEYKHGRFEPSHALVMSAWTAFSPAVSLSETELDDYRRGLILNKPCEKGWISVTIKGHAAGLAKSDGAVLKNHYPKAFRIR